MHLSYSLFKYKYLSSLFLPFFLFVLIPLSVSSQPKWIRANFHAHTKSERIHDDGKESAVKLHEALAKRGIQFSVHSIHSVFNGGKQATDLFQQQKQQEEQNRLHLPITISVGEELTVQKGPHYQGPQSFLGQSVPGNLNHLTLLGIKTWVVDGTPLDKACQQAHQQNGVCLVNHPGLGVNPSPMMWEPGLWENEKNRHFVDGLEVYNGVGYAASGLHFERRYLEATAFSKLGMKIAATASSDTHGAEHFQMVKRRFAKAGILKILLGLRPPIQSPSSPEFDAFTFVFTSDSSEAKVIEAIQQRKTIAAYHSGEIDVFFPELGEIKHTKKVDLTFSLSKKAEHIFLYKEGVLLKSWKQQNQIHFQEETLQKAAYVFAVELQNGGRLMTSAVFYEP